MVVYAAAFEREAGTSPRRTFGDDLDRALEAAMYGLAVAPEFRIDVDEAWPEPSPALAGERLIRLPVLIDAELVVCL